MAEMIHQTACIDSAAQLAEGVRIGPYVVIEGNVRIGPGCTIMAHAWIGGNTSLGEGCVVHPHAVLGDVPQDFSYDPSKVRSALEIGNFCVFREGVTVHLGSKDGGATRIGDHVYLMACSHVGHDGLIGDHVTMANSALLAGHVVVGEGAFISGNVSVHQHVHIGKLAMIGASTFLSQDIPPFCTAQGVPGRVVCLNSVGLKRNGYDQQGRTKLKKIFRLLYHQGLSLARALEELERLEDTDADCVADFIRSTKRGIASSRTHGRVNEL